MLDRFDLEINQSNYSLIVLQNHLYKKDMVRSHCLKNIEREFAADR